MPVEHVVLEVVIDAGKDVILELLVAEEPVIAAGDVEVVVVPADTCIHLLSLELYLSPFSVDNCAWLAGNSLTSPHMEGLSDNKEFSVFLMWNFVFPFYHIFSWHFLIFLSLVWRWMLNRL